MKVEENRILLYFVKLSGTYHKNLAIWKLLILKSGKFWPFFQWTILSIGQIHIFQVEIW
jgi:hypothetical protein